MKKGLVLCVLALSLTSCDFLSNITFVKSIDFEENSDAIKKNHEGVYLNIDCQNFLLVKETPSTGNDYSPKLTLASTQIGSTTIKRVNGEITFYQTPIFGESQLEVVNDSDTSRLDSFFFEQQVIFKDIEDQPIDFVYFTDIQFSCKNPDNKIFKNFRLAILDKETHSDYFVLSYEKNGLESKTSYNLDMNGDKELDKAQATFAFEGSDSELINYTTGEPYYMTDNYEMCIPSQNDIDADTIPDRLKVMNVANNKPLTIRMWIEGWELDINDKFDSQIDITLKLAPHFAK